MNNNKKKGCLAIILALATVRRVDRKCWVKEWLRKREKFTHIYLLREIALTSAEDDYKNYFRMNECLFRNLINMVHPFLKRKDTLMRETLSTEERLSLTLRYLATGRSYEHLKFSVIISPSAISQAIMETCKVLVSVLQKYIKFPLTSDEWKAVSHDFGIDCKFWNCVGAVDEKHIAIKKPAHSGSDYINYKGFYSIVLLAIVNSKREFLMVDVGINGRISDGGVLFHSKFGELMQREELHLPPPSEMPNTTETFPVVFIGDEAFALTDNFMKPYSQKTLNDQRKVFNRRLSSARAVVENAFGILSSRFGVLGKTIQLEPMKAARVVLACCYLHNFLMQENAEDYFFSIGESFSESPLQISEKSRPHRNNTRGAKETRDKF